MNYKKKSRPVETKQEFKQKQQELKKYRESKLKELLNDSKKKMTQQEKKFKQLRNKVQFDDYTSAKQILFSKKTLKQINSQKLNTSKDDRIKSQFHALGSIKRISIQNFNNSTQLPKFSQLKSSNSSKQCDHAIQLQIQQQHKSDHKTLRSSKSISSIKLSKGFQQSNIPTNYIIHPALWTQRALDKALFLKKSDKIIKQSIYKSQQSLKSKKLLDHLRCTQYLKLLGSYADCQIQAYDNQHTDSMKISSIFHCLNHVLIRNSVIEENTEKYNKENQMKSKKQRLLLEISKATGLDKESVNQQIQSDDSENEQEEVKIQKRTLRQIQEDDDDVSDDFTKDIIQNQNYFSKKLMPIESIKQSYKNIFESYQDQGFTSCKVFILAPFKLHAAQIVKQIMNLLNNGTWKGVSKSKAFKQQYIESQQEKYNDCFKIGIKFQKSSIKLFHSFQTADIIIASPLGLKTLKGQQQQDELQLDFLSSIQILLLYNAQIFQFQNLQLLEQILLHTNNIPKNITSLNDINRIMPLFLDGESNKIRQTITLAQFFTLETCYLHNKFSSSQRGCLELSAAYQISMKKSRAISQFLQAQKDVSAILRKIKVDDIEMVEDAKFNFFTKTQWQRINQCISSHTLILCSSYLDFLRLKKFFTGINASLSYISQYSTKGEAQRERNFFQSGRTKFLLYTERAFFFNKILLRFADNVIFYSLPECPQVFIDVLHLVDREKESIIWKIINQTIKPKTMSKKIMVGVKKSVSNDDDDDDDDEIKIQGEREFEQFSKTILSGSIRRSIMALISKYDQIKLKRLFPSNMVRELLEEGQDIFEVKG